MVITAAQHLPQHQQGILGHRQISQLPPLKQHVPQIISSPPDSQDLYPKPVQSIIKSHPPQRAKAWKPITCPMELSAASKSSNEHVSMRNKGGFLQAQTLLIGERTKKRQQHIREQQRIYTSTVGGAGNSQIEKIRVVSRPTQRDIFWDETKGQNLDFRELLQPSPPLMPEADSGMEEMTRRLKSEVGLKGNLSRDLNESVTISPGRIRQQNLPWLEDFRKNEQNHLNTWDIVESQWGHKLWQDTHWESRENEEGEMEGNTSGQVNSVHRKWNHWDKLT
ncbi:hypothetical protein Q7C36_011594 [Tachysurus vachellii]|uniref:Uncharacterized protein n=2 Tax=Tachysurus vachellii TaxID=175792 RepID=A0AA88SU91_TACVA|nr:hypothetical protein Q7C36_011594 [Tachysurus vachellii]